MGAYRCKGGGGGRGELKNILHGTSSCICESVKIGCCQDLAAEIDMTLQNCKFSHNSLDDLKALHIISNMPTNSLFSLSSGGHIMYKLVNVVDGSREFDSHESLVYMSVRLMAVRYSHPDSTFILVDGDGYIVPAQEIQPALYRAATDILHTIQ